MGRAGAGAAGSTYKPFPPLHKWFTFDFSGARPPTPEEVREAIVEVCHGHAGAAHRQPRGEGHPQGAGGDPAVAGGARPGGAAAQPVPTSPCSSTTAAAPGGASSATCTPGSWGRLPPSPASRVWRRWCPTWWPSATGGRRWRRASPGRRRPRTPPTCWARPRRRWPRSPTGKRSSGRGWPSWCGLAEQLRPVPGSTPGVGASPSWWAWCGGGCTDKRRLDGRSARLRPSG